MIYLDNAATSFKKPESVYLGVDQAMRHYSGNPGRSGHKLSLAAREAIEETRRLILKLISAKKTEEIIFTKNATESLNLAIKGVLRPGDHVITSTLEHNSVTRPLEELKSHGIQLTKIPCSVSCGADIEAIKSAIRPNTKLMVFTHISNVTGTINPIKQIGELCRERNILFLVDAAQSIGVYSINVQEMCIDLLAFPGHKGLLGPQGTGGLYMRSGIDVLPLIEGGTGIHSELLLQPKESPYCYESGTLNTAGIYGLGKGIQYILDKGVERIHSEETFLANRLLEGLSQINEVTLYGPGPYAQRSSVVSITIDGIDTMDCAFMLDNVFDIAVRAGLHCAPDTHTLIGTVNTGGTLRISPNHFNTTQDIDACIQAIKAIVKEGRWQ
ncbi:aminotransferase class V-fold PLP-dependent enzyme [Cellulosilyticum sp. I15G10I2]|uniref:aminotransferase class V-fold PLP-dependent enzyme n=1 Tax=Cellulosilyticum sp. I15G10I2 TaxID=1892843 RepID=UPI00085C2727|nr:aminotransferase class V-fold PLP-dependent enzyme [Cellulosilyticum sp. I15G10I2]